MKRPSQTAVTVLLLTGITVFSRLLGFVRELILASAFGVSEVSDALVSAQFVPLFAEVVVFSSLAVTLVPLFTALKGEERQGLLSSFAFFSGLIWSGVSLLLMVGAPWLMPLLVPGLSPAAEAQAVGLLRVFAPVLLLTALSSFFTPLLQVQQRFLITALATLAPNVAIILATLLYQDQLTVWIVAWTTVAGTGVQLLVLLLVALKGGGLAFRWANVRWRHLVPALSLSGPLIAANGLIELTALADKFFGSQLAAGSISALGYAGRLVQMPASVLVSGLTTVLHTRFSRLLADGEQGALQAELGTTLQAITWVMVPLTVLSISLAEPAVRLIYERGTFDQRAVLMTSEALRWYAVSLIPMALTPLLTNLTLSLKISSVQLKANLLALVVYFITVFLFQAQLQHGALALALSLGLWAALVVVGWALARRLGPEPFLLVVKALGPSLVAALAAYLSLWGAVQLLPVSPLSQLVGGGLAGGLAYLVALFGLRFLSKRIKRVGELS